MDGFAELEAELSDAILKIGDQAVHKRSLNAGADIILERSKQILAPHRRTGQLLESLNKAVVRRQNLTDIEIGWGGDFGSTQAHGFYGLFLDNGFRNVKSGRFTQLQHLKSVHEAEKENVLNAMLEVYEEVIRE